MQKVFHNSADLYAYLKQVKQTPEFGKLCERKARSIATAEAMKLKKMIKENIENYYTSYEPKEYIRTYRLKEALVISRADWKDNVFTAVITFDIAKTTRDSIFKNGGRANSADLINRGWSWKKAPPGGHIEHFTRYGGFGFIEQAVSDYQAQSKYKANITIQYKTY